MKGSGKREHYRDWLPVEVEKLRAVFPNSPTKEVARMLGRTESSINGQAAKLGLRKSPAYLAGAFKKLLAGLGNGIRYRFPKGHVPANKGVRRPGWSAGRMRETQFKKGQRPQNTMPVGTVQANADGYLRIKVADAAEPPGRRGGRSPNWEFVHRRVWEAVHGPIPKGHRIWWKDRDHTNCALENLELLTDAEHMARTTIHRTIPPNLKKTIYALIALKRAIGRKRRASDGQEQAVRRA